MRKFKRTLIPTKQDEWVLIATRIRERKEQAGEKQKKNEKKMKKNDESIKTKEFKTWNINKTCKVTIHFKRWFQTKSNTTKMKMEYKENRCFISEIENNLIKNFQKK